MKKGYTHIAIVLDESGSMSSLKRATIDSFNKFLKEQREVPGEATISLIKFSTVVQAQYHFQGIQQAPELNDESYNPSATTALYDAEGWTIEYTGKRLAEMREDERPDKVIIVIITDGAENASTDFTRERIEALIKQQEEVYKWQFVFLGANQSATMSAQSMGMNVNSALSYAASPRGVVEGYSAMSAQIGDFRKGLSKEISFTGNQRQLQKILGAHDDDLNRTGSNAPPVATPDRDSSSKQGWKPKSTTP